MSFWETNGKGTPEGALQAALAGIGDFSESDFHAFEITLVKRYRIRPADQEWIAVELSRHSGENRNAKASERIEEIQAMLDHVHDPLISGSALLHA